MPTLLSLLLATVAVATGPVAAAASRPALALPTHGQALAVAVTLPAIVLVLNTKYLQVFENFIRAPGAVHMAQFDVHVICTDREMDGELSKLGWRCRTTVIARGGGASRVYTKRIPYVVSLIRMGRDVLICDIDAIWIRDPLPKLLATRAGIVSSPGLSPGDAIKKYGVAFCMGFIFIRGSDLKVRDAMFALTKPMREDQGDFNQNMMREGLEYDTIKVGFTNETSYGRLHARGKSYDGLRVAMLPRSRFMRQCSPNTDFTATGNVVIAHCHSHGKQPYLKTKILSEMKLWFVPPPADGISVPQPDTDPPMPEPGTQAWTAWHNRSTQ